LDLDLILDHTITQWEYYADFGVHDIELCLMNKQIHDTVIDADGNIISDLFVTIESIKIDNFEFKDEIDSISSYTDADGNIVNTFGFLGFTTPYNLLIQTPGYLLKRNVNILANKDILVYLSECYNKS